MRARQYPCRSHPASDLLLSARKLHPFAQAPQQHDSGSNSGFTQHVCKVLDCCFGEHHGHMLCLHYNSTWPAGCYACMQLIRLSEGNERLITCNRGSSLAQQNSAGLLPNYAVSTYLLYLHTSHCGDDTLYPLSLVMKHHSHSFLG